MTELLLRSELAPLAEQQRRLRLRQRLALCWGGATVLGLGLLGFRYAGAISTTGLGIGLALAAVACAFFIRSRVASQQPDFRQIARDIEQRHPDLHTVLLTAVEQGRDPQSGRLNYLQERVITGALMEIKKREQLAAVEPRHLFLAQAAHLTALAAFVLVLFNTIEFKRNGPSSAAAPLAGRSERPAMVAAGWAASPASPRAGPEIVAAPGEIAGRYGRMAATIGPAAVAAAGRASLRSVGSPLGCVGGA